MLPPPVTSHRRVVVTGMGIACPLGIGVEHVWKRLLAGESGIGPITLFDPAEMPNKIAGQIPEGPAAEGKLTISDWVPFKDQKKMDRFIQFGMVAAAEAIADSGWAPTGDEDLWATGVLVGSGIGGLKTISDNSLSLASTGLKRISPFFIPASLINLASGQISIRYGFKGPNHAVVTACATGVHAIGDAARLIMWGDADVMIAGGTEAAICDIGIAGFCAARALSTGFNDQPGRASRPWDRDRDGFVMGEGAGILVLEELEHAKARGARIYAEICGYGLSGDAYHITAPAEGHDGAFRAMKAAFRNGGLGPQDVDYINAHGTSTPIGDDLELEAVERMFGNYAGQVAMSSTKSATGHLLGAAGAIEAVFSILAIRDNVAPPTLNLDTPSRTSAIDRVAHTAQQRKIDVALSNSFGFGGTNASVLFAPRPDFVRLAVALMAAAISIAAQAPPAEVGRWRTQDHASIIAIEPCGMGLCGRIVGVGLDHPTDKRPLDMWGNPQCGESIIDMPRRGSDRRWHGTILDPRSGRRWHAQIWRDPTGLRLRGYIGLPLFGATQTWMAYKATLGPDCYYDRG